MLSLRGTETMSGLDECVVTVGSSAETAAKLDEALGREALLIIERAGDESSLRRMRGIVEEVFPSGVTVGKSQRQTEIKIVPRLKELEHSRSCQVFQDVDVVEIARQLFGLWQIELEARLRPQPLKREYCTQINETDLDFLSRILSEEGIHFHLDHREDKSVVVLVNDARGYEPIVGEEILPYRDAQGAVTVEHVKSIRRERRVATGAVAYRDYNFVKPQREMAARTETNKPNDPATLTARELYEYPGHYNDPDEESAGLDEAVQGSTRSGMARTKMRLEEQRSRALTFSGTSTCLRMRVGQLFQIIDHTDEAFNRKYLVTGLTIVAESSSALWLDRGDRTPIAGAGLSIEFSAVPAEVTIRPCVRPKPPAHLRIARVVGPKEDEPYVDEYGRVKIQFAWDREGQLDEKSSCWVRMATPVAHHNQGSYVAHRVGAEVVVDFLDGDIDRPIVIGALYNGENRQPQALPDDATRAVLYRGLSVPGNKGKNEISCEDRAGSEEIFLHAQKDLNEQILNDHNEAIAVNQTSTVGVNQVVSVGVNQMVNVGANRTVTIGANETITVMKKRKETVSGGEEVTVSSGRTHAVATGDESLTVEAGDRKVTVAKKDELKAKERIEQVETTIDVSAGTSIKIHRNADDATFELKAGEALLATSTKIVLSNESSRITMDGGVIEIAAAEELILSSGGAKLSLKQDGTWTAVGSKEVELACSNSKVKLVPAKASMSGAEIDVTAVGNAVLGGSKIMIG